jgi:hypothetical protein
MPKRHVGGRRRTTNSVDLLLDDASQIDHCSITTNVRDSALRCIQHRDRSAQSTSSPGRQSSPMNARSQALCWR